MKLVGKYNIVKKNKKQLIIENRTLYNVITDIGRQQILLLFKAATPTNTFKDMHGYKVLDLKPYKLKPILPTGDITYTHTDYENELMFEDENNEWLVESSLFFTKKFGEKFKLNCPINYQANINTTLFSDYSYILKNNMSETEANDVLYLNNKKTVIWLGNADLNSMIFYLYNNTHNIDFFRVYCKQKIIVKKAGVIVDLWKGDLINDIDLTKMDVVYKTDLNLNYLICLNVKYKIINVDVDYQDLNIADYSINTITGKILFNDTDSDVFPSLLGTKLVEVIVEYYVHYKDKQLDNGICGMFLNYDLIKDDDLNDREILNRSLFGNGIFSSNAGKTWDNYITFPWSGKPMLYNRKYYGLYESVYYGTYYYFHRDISYNYKPMIFTTYDKRDYVNERFCSFYPYMYKNSTNFTFYTHLLYNSINMKNFLFLIPEFLPQTPKTFVFGTGTADEVQTDIQLGNLIFRLDAEVCLNLDDSESILQWKTYIDYNTGNNVVINELGLFFGDMMTEKISLNWGFIRPSKKEECDKLFSRVKLTTPISKDELLTLEITYKIEWSNTV